jgi:two-component system, cell cycle response regulator
MNLPQDFRIVVVDDDAAIRRLVLLYLRRQEYDVFEFDSGAEARKFFFEHGWDLAILDRRLPDIDGLRLCNEIKSRREFRNRYVIVLTGEDEQEDKLEGFDLGADDYVTKPFQPAELLARIRAAKRIVDLQKELMESNRQLELLSITDGLTQLYNHRFFQEEFARKFEEASRYEQPLSLALIDIDHFKKVNDTWGHAVGDEVLKSVSRIFQSSVRKADVAARYGGEEFAVIMPQTDLGDARSFAEKVRTLIGSESIPTAAGSIPVTVSIGISSIPENQLASPLEMVDAADKALYRAKEGGRNQVHWERREDPKRPTIPAESS